MNCFNDSLIKPIVPVKIKTCGTKITTFELLLFLHISYMCLALYLLCPSPISHQLRLPIASITKSHPLQDRIISCKYRKVSNHNNQTHKSVNQMFVYMIVELKFSLHGRKYMSSNYSPFKFITFTVTLAVYLSPSSDKPSL